MKIRSAVLVSVLSLVGLTGCASPSPFGGGYYSKELPTLERVEKSPYGFVVHYDTSFFPGDFTSNGSLKSIDDYNYEVETAPCTVLGTVYQVHSTSKYFYVVGSSKDGQEIAFQCRADRTGTNRLFLMGSAIECEDRHAHRMPSLWAGKRKYDKLCHAGAPRRS